MTDGFLAGTLKRRLRSEPVVDDSQEALKVAVCACVLSFCRAVRKVEVCACVLSCCRVVRKVGVLCGLGVLRMLLCVLSCCRVLSYTIVCCPLWLRAPNQPHPPTCTR